MQIGNRIFPYPVLNKNADFSGYKPDSKFGFQFDTDRTGSPIVIKDHLILKNLHFTLEDADLNTLLLQEKIKGLLIVECSHTAFRKSYPITTKHSNLKIPSHFLFSTIVVSCYLFATENIRDFKSSGFQPEFDDYTFNIDRFDILAVDDGFKFNNDMNSADDNKVSSIFTIVKKETSDDLLTYSNDENKIVIQMPHTYYESYNAIKRKSDFNNIAFAMIAIPVLSSCLKEIQLGEFSSINEIIESKRWFKAVCISHRRETGQELSKEIFFECNTLSLAQQVLNYSSCNGIKGFSDILTGMNGGIDEDE